MKLSFAFLLSLLPATSLSLKVTVQNATVIAQLIAGPGVTIKSARMAFGKSSIQMGTFSEGRDSIGFSKGAILATGKIQEAADFNEGDGPLYRVGYTALSALTLQETYDAAVLKITFSCPTNKQGVFSNYVFASNEYPNQYAQEDDHPYEDVMGIFLNGEEPKNNIAIVNGKYVSIRTLFSGSKYIDNTDEHLNVNVNGLTIPLKTKVVQGKKSENTIRFAVAEGGDETLTSYLFIREDGLQCV